MTQELKYLSPEWREEAEKRLREELSAERMKQITSSMTSIYKNCPGGVDRYLHLRYEGGLLAAIETGEGDPPAAEFTITGDYETFAKITRSETRSQIALMTGKLKLKGNMVKALKLAAIVDRFNKVLSKIPTAY